MENTANPERKSESLLQNESKRNKEAKEQKYVKYVYLYSSVSLKSTFIFQTASWIQSKWWFSAVPPSWETWLFYMPINNELSHRNTTWASRISPLTSLKGFSLLVMFWRLNFPNIYSAGVLVTPWTLTALSSLPLRLFIILILQQPILHGALILLFLNLVWTGHHQQFRFLLCGLICCQPKEGWRLLTHFMKDSGMHSPSIGFPSGFFLNETSYLLPPAASLA